MQTKLGVVFALLCFVALAWMVELIAGLHAPIAFGPLGALVLAAVPCLVWLGYFHWQDRAEPKPKHFVAGVAVLGGLVAAPVSEFVLAQLAPPVALAQHGGAFALDRIVEAIFMVGLAQEMCKYAVVRYSIYLSTEFAQPLDGIVYMMSVGTGFALWLNYHHMVDPGHAMRLAEAASRAATVTLAHASFAGVLGYVLGRAKFSHRSTAVRSLLLWLGLGAAALINGHFALVQAYFDRDSRASLWSVGYAALLAVLVFAGLRAILQRDAQRAEARQAADPRAITAGELPPHPIATTASEEAP